jgi:hypothetical protein
MSAGFQLTDKERAGKSIYNKVGDKVTPERIEDPLKTNISEVSGYIDFTDITAPGSPNSGLRRVYSKSTGVDSGIFVQNSSGTELELASTASAAPDFDQAYNNGSDAIVNVDAYDIDFRLTAPYKFEVTNASGTNNFFSVSTTSIDIDGALTINGSGTSTTDIHTGSTGALDIGGSTGGALTLDSGSTVTIGANATNLSLASTGVTTAVAGALTVAQTATITGTAILHGVLDANSTSTFAGTATFSSNVGITGAVTTDLTVNQDIKGQGFYNLNDTSATIAGGVITAGSSFMTVDTQGGGATDDLDTINGGTDGDILILQAADSSRTVVVKDGTGNLNLTSDFSLDHVNDKIMLINIGGSTWDEVSRSNNT